MAYTLTLSVSYDPVGEAVDFEGYLYKDGVGLSGYGIIIYQTDVQGNIIERVYYTVTDVEPAGHYYGYVIKQDIPRELWGKPIYFRSYSESHGIYSPVRSVIVPPGMRLEQNILEEPQIVIMR
mgnify:CR=1 FL=1